MLNRLKSEDEGFTLIELLVVILIIGILAAIALPSFLGQQKKGQDAGAKSNAHNAFTDIKSCGIDTSPQNKFNDASCVIDPSNVSAVGASTKGAVSVQGAAQDTFTVSAWSDSGRSYNITLAATGVQYRCWFEPAANTACDAASAKKW